MSYFQIYIPLAIAVITFGGIVWASTAVLKTSLGYVDAQIEDMRKDLKQLNSIVVTQTAQDGVIARIEDRLLSQGKRLDEGLTRLNNWIDNTAKHQIHKS